MIALLHKLYACWKAQGLRQTIRRAGNRVANAWYEWRLGIRSAAYIRISDLGIDDPAYHDYEPTDYTDLQRIFRSLPLDPARDVLLDYGAGMGRVMAAAAMHPFRKIIGIELTRELSTIARTNLERRRGPRRCAEVELVTADACSYQVPPEVTVIYLFNSFSGEVLAAALDRIHQSLEESWRKVTLVFCAPPMLHDNPLGRCLWLRLSRRVQGARDRAIYFYESTIPRPEVAVAAAHRCRRSRRPNVESRTPALASQP